MSKITHWNPLTDRWGQDLPRLFDEMVERFQGPQRKDEGRKVSVPPVDIIESPEAFVVRADLPGIDPSAVRITMTGDTLTIRGDKRREETREEDHWHIAERHFGAYERSITFPTPVDPDAVNADAEHGVLTITLRKVQEAQPRQIQVHRK